VQGRLPRPRRAERAAPGSQARAAPGSRRGRRGRRADTGEPPSRPVAAVTSAGARSVPSRVARFFRDTRAVRATEDRKAAAGASREPGCPRRARERHRRTREAPGSAGDDSIRPIARTLRVCRRNHNREGPRPGREGPRPGLSSQSRTATVLLGSAVPAVVGTWYPHEAHSRRPTRRPGVRVCGRARPRRAPGERAGGGRGAAPPPPPRPFASVRPGTRPHDEAPGRAPSPRPPRSRGPGRRGPRA